MERTADPESLCPPGLRLTSNPGPWMDPLKLPAAHPSPGNLEKVKKKTITYVNLEIRTAVYSCTVGPELIWK